MARTLQLPGASIPLRPWCISPLFQISPIFEQFSDSEENFHNFTFSRRFFWFSSAEISDDPFLSHRPKISNFPPFFLFHNISPSVSRKLLFSPLLWQISPVLHKFTCFLHTLRVFFPPTLTMMHLCITQCTYWTPLPFTIIHHIYKRWYKAE